MDGTSNPGPIPPMTAGPDPSATLKEYADEMRKLGQLICDLNPYTEVTDPTTGKTTGTMHLTTVPDPETLRRGVEPPPPPGPVPKVSVEVEDNYGDKWVFKGQSYDVKAAVKIPYRYPVQKDKGKNDDKNLETLYWRTEYLLIGFAGGDGPG